MTSLFRFYSLILFCLLPLTGLLSQEVPSCHHGHGDHHRPALQFIPNHRQWDDRIVYASALGGINRLLLEEDRFTFVVYDPAQSAKLHDRMQDRTTDAPVNVSGHAYSVRFEGAQTPVFSAGATAEHRVNYLLGNDPARWAKQVPVHGKVVYGDLYPGIDLEAYSDHGNFKYDFVVSPAGDPASISLAYSSLDSIDLVNGELVLTTSVGELRELHPYAYQTIGERRITVPCHYVLNGRNVTFALPEGYDTSLPLVIDPTVIGATLAGSSGMEAYGHSATSDNAGNMYGAGISFGFGYPTTDGAFQENFRGGNIDIAVSKYNALGTDLLYATYLGGNNAEYPHSMVVDASGQLSLYGTSLSNNYPTTANAVQPSLRGNYDIVVSKLSPDGSTLVGSTFMGGSRADGNNSSIFNVGNGDNYRGEIVLDGSGNIYIATCSESEDFPVTSNALQTTRGDAAGFGQQQDGVVFKLNSDLSTLFWSTYLGGTAADLASSLRVADDNSVYVSGFAGSSDFPMPSGGLLENWPGGNESAFVVRIAPDGSELLNGTFWGTGSEDRSYFLDTDELNQVHIFGLSQGNIPVTEGVYSTPGGGKQFITGFTEDLSQTIYSTVFGLPGDGFSRFDFLPVAFMVDKCNGIYISGHSSREGLPLTADAVYEEPNSFYLAKLEPDAADLTFGTYYGRANHVDGGTSRFDKAGIVYQGVCSCTDGNRVMNTTDGAWRENQITRCDIGVFKIDFDVDVVTAQGVASPSTSGCAPLTIDFEYTGRDAQVVSWDFGTGDTGSGETFTYTFEESGIYTVRQIAESPTSCNPTDTFYLEIVVLDENSTRNEIGICDGEETIFLDASTPGASYTWQDGSTAATYQPDDQGIYWVDITIEGCTRRDSFELVPQTALNLELGEDQRFCDTPSYTLDATEALATGYEWQNGSGAPSLTATTSGTYAVTLTDANGCRVSDEITLEFNESAVIDLGDDQTICAGDSALLDATAANTTYEWQDGFTGAVYPATSAGLYRVETLRDGCPSADSIRVGVEEVPVLAVASDLRVCPGETDAAISVLAVDGGETFTYNWSDGETGVARTNLAPGDYAVTVSNEVGCTTTEQRTVIETEPMVLATESVPVPCNQDSGGTVAVMVLSGGTAPFRYSLNGENRDSASVFSNLTGGVYFIGVEDAEGCTAGTNAELIAPRPVSIDAGADAVIRFGDSTRLTAQANWPDGLAYAWLPEQQLSCANCPRTFASPFENTTYLLTVTDTLSGCTYTDSVRVLVNQIRRVYTPNAFSPNGDGVNDRFFIQTDQSVASISFLKIYGRWGQLVYDQQNLLPNDPTRGWDGLINGRPAAAQIFVYTCEVVFLDGRRKTFEGELNLLR